MDEAVDRVYRAFRFWLDAIIGNCAAAVLLGATLLAITEIFRRYILGVVFEWGQDAVTYMVISAMFLYFAVTQARRGHLIMSAGIDAMRAKGLHRTLVVLRTGVSVLSIGIFTGFVSWGIPTLERTILMERKTQSMILLVWPFQTCLIVGFGLMALVTLFHLYQDVRALMGTAVFTWSPPEEATDI